MSSADSRANSFCTSQMKYIDKTHIETQQMEGNHNTIQKDYYKDLEVGYDATEENIRLNYLRLALKWHPDKHKGDSAATAKFQEINEAYKVLSDPAKRLDYDLTGIYEIDKYTLRNGYRNGCCQ